MFEVKFNILSSPSSTVVLKNDSVAICTIIDNTSKWLIASVYKINMHHTNMYVQLCRY